jgi:hypothetical protein
MLELRGRIVVKALRYKPKGPDEVNAFFSIYLILSASLDPGVDSATNINEYQKQKYVFGE